MAFWSGIQEQAVMLIRLLMEEVELDNEVHCRFIFWGS